MPSRQYLFSLRGWFLFLCFSIVAAFRLLHDDPLNNTGLLLIAGGWMIRLAAAFYIGDHTNKEVLSGSQLATSGIYSMSRNPMYLGNLLICEGVLVFSNCFAWMLHGIMLLLVFLYYRQVVVREENYLAEEFGQKYQEYMKKTPRWIGAGTFQKLKSHDWKPVSSTGMVVKIQWANAAKTLMVIFILWLEQ
jgi:protein-S-isoprenylcysteine O-methyltransferase Ste14